VNLLRESDLNAACPKCPAPGVWAHHLSEAAEEFGIITPLRLSHWLAQLAHESTEFTRLEEDLNYRSAARLAAVWPTRFWVPDEKQPIRPASLLDAREYVRSPEKLANEVYASRNGNGPPASNDGWVFRGGGPPQLTGRENYRRAGEALGLLLEQNPDLARRDIRVGARVAAWFFAKYKTLLPLADRNDLKGVTRRFNGGLTGLNDREWYLNRFMQILKG